MGSRGAWRIGLSIAALVTAAHVLLLAGSWLTASEWMALEGIGASRARDAASVAAREPPREATRVPSDWRSRGLDRVLACARGYAFGASPCSWEAALPRARSGPGAG